MMTLREVLNAKGHDVYSVGSTTSVFDALPVMADRNVGAVLIIDGAQTHGIFTERDYARQVALKGRASKDTPVRDVMTGRVVCVTPDQTMEYCMALMTSKRCRHLPVIDGDRVVGLLPSVTS